MAEDWLKTQADITSDLKKDGAEFIFKRQPEAEYDPITGGYLPVSDSQIQEFKAYGIIKSLSSTTITSTNYNASWFPEMTVERGDKILLVDCSAYEPQLEDRLELYRQTYSVKASRPVEPGIVPLIQYLLVRKA